MLASALLSCWMLTADGAQGKESAPKATLLIELGCGDDRSMANLAEAVQTRLSLTDYSVALQPLADMSECGTETKQLVREHLAAATQAFERLDLEGSRAAAEKALAVFLDARSLLGDRGLYAEVRMLLGWINLELRAKDVSRGHFAAVAAVEPDYSPTRNRYPPEVYKGYAESLQRLARDRSTLSVTSSPPGAMATLDERLSCVTPCELTDLARGPHFLTLTLEGWTSAKQIVQTPRASGVTLTLNSIPTSAATARVRLVPRSGGGAHATLSTASGASAELDVSVADPADSAERIAAALATAKPVGAAPEQPPPSDAAGWTVRELLWPWGVIAGGALAIGGGLLAYYLTRPETVTVVVTPP